MDAATYVRALDMNSAYLGVSRLVLMENAGKELALASSGFYDVAVFAGCGNNGGDGLVAARHLSSTGKKVSVYALAGRRTRENEINYDVIKRLSSIKTREIRDCADISEIKKELQGCDLVIDAMLGTGACGVLREPFKSAVGLINSLKACRIAADVPTPGLKADKVISFHTKKAPYSKVVNIGIPKEAETLCGPGDVYAAIPPRTGTEHKGDFGRLLVVGGSRDYVRTTVLVARAAFRTGIDLVTIATPKYAADRIRDPNVIVKSLPSRDHLSAADMEEVLETNHDVIVIGNGIALHEDTREFVNELIRKIRKPAVVDADALKLLDEKNVKKNLVLTPHAMEFRALFGEYDELNRVTLVEEKARKTKATILLKGPVDVVSNGVLTKQNRTHNPGMTVGGTGDVLAGIAGAFCAKTQAFQAASAAAFLSGVAGNLCRDEMGYSYTATDVIEKIPAAKRYCMNFGD